jgi:hypothetical protein
MHQEYLKYQGSVRIKPKSAVRKCYINCCARYKACLSFTSYYLFCRFLKCRCCQPGAADGCSLQNCSRVLFCWPCLLCHLVRPNTYYCEDPLLLCACCNLDMDCRACDMDHHPCPCCLCLDCLCDLIVCVLCCCCETEACEYCCECMWCDNVCEGECCDCFCGVICYFCECQCCPDACCQTCECVCDCFCEGMAQFCEFTLGCGWIECLCDGLCCLCEGVGECCESVCGCLCD